MSLRHIAIPSCSRSRTSLLYPTYALATRVQSKLQQGLLAWKAGASDPHHQHHPQQHLRSTPPLPTLLSFTPAPTYTLGRRQTEPLSEPEVARLRAPLTVYSTDTTTRAFVPELLHAPRGGLTTYHGPGQVVLWPVIDLRSPLHTHFTVRDYTCLLEKTTIATLGRLYQITGFTTSNPGVWVRADGDGREERKISALGVHLRRHVTGLGVAINFGMPVTGPESVNPWARIVACGLGDKTVTSVAAHLDLSPLTVRAEDIALAWADEFATRLGLRDADGGSGVECDDWGRWEEELCPNQANGDYVEAQPLGT
ncbi:uncharacterized protein GGS25DRAFT_524374 [Hypoxylon fragiforme]|uniref:uncharacterized protein n=1 Tax=Hypoxylon fragiforme TaxID=63214 RepID=UPI0020C64293|nr:uncharacterized protein GGS25DRAFT_524374 [Hypoxylon fragiforme]KAI2604879.1 hypothetical protein GGS25DRAFT_524374 [Hypoxylon fragiforme]